MCVLLVLSSWPGIALHTKVVSFPAEALVREVRQCLAPVFTATELDKEGRVVRECAQIPKTKDQSQTSPTHGES